MVSAADLARELDEGLKQLFQAGLELSLQVQANAMAAEPAEQARLSLTFHRLSRGVRQTAALRMKLARDAERSQRETAEEIVQLDQRRLAKRKAHVKSAVEGLIWTEAESPEALETLNLDLEDVLAIETQDAESFESEPVGAQIKRLCEVIGLKIPPLLGEGASAVDSQRPGLSGSPLSPSGTAPPSGGAIENDDPLLSDDYWRSSA
ncbi:MAG: hypothetical protein JWP49_2862 [Phenylobacterium sp.]|jgi:hypothetical protein|nr:hypothetical protein [Phenylobacterium sp.]